MSALEGMRVLDISQFESGPSCAQWLAWYGAEVVRVDLPRAEAAVASSVEDTLHLANNLNKKSVALDLRSREGLALFYRLVPRFDVVVENFAYGQAEKMKLDYPALKAINPGIIYCSIKGFGLSGPYRDYRALDPVAQAAGGGMAVTGVAGGPPMRAGYVAADNVTGTCAATGVLAAYVKKLRTGMGDLVEVSMQEAAMHMMRSTLLTRRNYPDGRIPRRGNRMTPPTDTYPCAPGGADDYVMIVTPRDDLVGRLFDAIGRPELKRDPRFGTIEQRKANPDALWEEIASWTRARGKFEAMDLLAKFGVPVSAVFNAEDIDTDRHLAARGAIVTVEHPQRGSTRVAGNPVRLHGARVALAAAPILGEHTREVLNAELGLDEAALDALSRARVIG